MNYGISLRSAVLRGLALATLALTTACEPDECSVDFSYQVTSAGQNSLFAYVWRAPATTCELAGSFAAGRELVFEDGERRLAITLPLGEPRVGLHAVETDYKDEFGVMWTSNSSEALSSGCTARLDQAELVEWMSNDHYRIRGSVQCVGPLAMLLEPENDDRLRWTDLRFTLYAGAPYY